MRHLLTGAIALLAGVVIGGLWPLQQLRDAQAQLADIDQQDCRGVGEGLAGMLHGRPLQPDDPQRWENELGDTPETSDEPSPPAVVDDQPEPAAIPDEELTRDDRMDAMRTGLSLRRTAARQALLDEAGPDEDQVQEIDGALDSMNDDLRAIAEDFVDEFGEGVEPTRKDMMLFAADTLDVLISADDAIRGSLDDEQLDAASDEAIDPLQYVDPSIVDLLDELDQ